MIGGRRILPRDLVGGIAVPKAPPGSMVCTRTIRLDGTTYCCGRQVFGAEQVHEGIHDAFVSHGDGGAVRW